MKSFEIKEWDDIIEDLYNKNLIGYRILTLDLSTSRNNEIYEIRGNFLQVIEIPDNPPEIEIIFNDLFEYPIPIKEKEQFILPFRRFYITNKVGSGKLKLFIGKNFELTPYTKLSGVSDFSPIVQKLQQIITSFETSIMQLYFLVSPKNIIADEITIQPNTTYLLFPSVEDGGRFFEIINYNDATLKIIFGGSSTGSLTLYPKTSYEHTKFPLSKSTSISIQNPNTIPYTISYWLIEV
ncbi:MAG: hypothetical protein NZ839_02880 [Endomicrobia bacterium]|nr:hypothetical protein [Endomicrobiia bacterium]